MKFQILLLSSFFLFAACNSGKNFSKATKRSYNSIYEAVTNFNEQQRLAMVQEIKRNGKREHAMTTIPGLGNVMNDALKLPDGIYVNVTIDEARSIASAWGCRLPTLSEARTIRAYAQSYGRVFKGEPHGPNNTAQRYANFQAMMNSEKMRRRSEIGRNILINGHFKWYIETGSDFSFYGFNACSSYCQNGGDGGHRSDWIDYSQSARFICD